MPHVIKRTKGRPARGAASIGKERLIEAARAILRNPDPPSLSRKAVAEAAGVTPALVSYYFPDRSHLLAAAAGPLIGESIGRLLHVLDTDADRRAKLRQIVVLSIGLNARDSQLIGYAIEDRADPSLGSLAAVARRRLIDFYREGVAAGEWRAVDPEALILAVWGMCRSVAEARATHLAEAAENQATDVDLILGLTLDGLAARS